MPTPTKKTWHLHACTTCGGVYDDSCPTPQVNSRCNPCISGIPSVRARGRAPVTCCRTNARLARKDELKTYRLAGNQPWFLCGTCHRAFAHDPRNT